MGSRSILDSNFGTLPPDQAKRFSKATSSASPLTMVSSGGKGRRGGLFTYAATLAAWSMATRSWSHWVTPGIFLEQKLRCADSTVGDEHPGGKAASGSSTRRQIHRPHHQRPSPTSTTATSRMCFWSAHLATLRLVRRSFSEGGSLSAKEGEVFLNNALLENGHAARKDKWEFGDWEPALLK